MSQQEFESRQSQDGEFYRPHYPYNWSDQAQQEGMPRDELPLHYDASRDYAGYQPYAAEGRTKEEQIPWWARPQPRQYRPFKFIIIVALIILITLLLGVLGVAGLVLGVILKFVGAIIGVILLLFLFFFLLAFLILALIARAIGRAFGPFWRRDSRMQRRSWRSYRRWL